MVFGKTSIPGKRLSCISPTIIQGGAGRLVKPMFQGLSFKINPPPGTQVPASNYSTFVFWDLECPTMTTDPLFCTYPVELSIR